MRRENLVSRHADSLPLLKKKHRDLVKVKVRIGERLSKISSNEGMEEAGSFSKIDHLKLPLDSPFQLYLYRLVVVSEKTEHDMSVRFPYKLSGCKYFRDKANGEMNGKMYYATELVNGISDLRLRKVRFRVCLWIRDSKKKFLMAYSFPEEVLENVFSFIPIDKDRNVIFVVCKSWYEVERWSPWQIFIGDYYAVSLGIVIRRLSELRSVGLKGKPHSAGFNLVPDGWGGNVYP